jgi:hypothetical protein
MRRRRLSADSAGSFLPDVRSRCEQGRMSRANCANRIVDLYLGLDLLAIAPRLRKRFGLGERARDIARLENTFVFYTVKTRSFRRDRDKGQVRCPF